MPLTLTKADGTVEKYEGEERSWVKEKEISGVAEEDTPDGKLKYRKWISIKGSATIKMG